MASTDPLKKYEGASARGGAPRLPVPVKVVPFEDYVNEGFGTALVEGVIPERSLVVLSGEDSEILLMDLIMHLAHGQHWHGQAVSRARKVAFLPGRELGSERAWMREWRNCRGGVQRGDLRILPGVDPASLPMEELLARLRAYGPDLVAINLSEFDSPACEQRPEATERLLKDMRELIAELGCSVLLADFLGTLAATNLSEKVDILAVAEGAQYEDQWVLEVAFDHFGPTRNPVADMAFAGEPMQSYQVTDAGRRPVTVSMVTRIFVPYE